MGIYTSGIYNDGERYLGCVLWTYERNGRDDSDWFAICWSEEKQEVVTVLYDTTRCGGYGNAEIDITPENLRKVYRYYYRIGREFFDSKFKYADAKRIEKGCPVIVTRGRKIPKGTAGTVFWIGTRYNPYSHMYEERVGIESNGERFFVPIEYIERTDWKSRISTGRERKRKIRNIALSSLPIYYKGLFEDYEFYKVLTCAK